MFKSLSAAAEGLVFGAYSSKSATFLDEEGTDAVAPGKAAVAAKTALYTFAQLLIVGCSLFLGRRDFLLTDRTVTRISYSAVALSGLWFVLSARTEESEKGPSVALLALDLKTLVYGSLYVALNTHGWRHPQSIALLGAAFAPPVINFFAASSK